MPSSSPVPYLVFLTVWAALIAGCQSGGGAHKLLGGIEVRDEQAQARQPTAAPQTIYVSDFALDADNYQPDEGLRDMLPGQRQGGLLGRIGQRLPHPRAGQDPTARARDIVQAMTTHLLQSLRDQGFSAQPLSGVTAPLPHDGWLINGVFTEVDEGNRLKRATIGFGRGATGMDVQVTVSDLASPNPLTPFILFGTVKDPKKVPGAVITMNPYVAAAKFVLEKNATDKDIKNTAEQIAKEIVKYAHGLQPKGSPDASPADDSDSDLFKTFID